MMIEESMRHAEKMNWTEGENCLFFNIRGAGTLIPGSRPLKSALFPPTVFSIRGAGTLIPGLRLLKSRVNIYFFLDAGGFSSLLCLARTNCSSLLYSVEGCGYYSS